MKTRVLKIIGVALITVSLAVSFFAIPVSAANDLYSVTFTFPVQSADSNYFRFWDTVSGANNKEWNELGDSTRGIYDPDKGSVTYYWNWNTIGSTDNTGWCSFYIGRSNFGGVTSYSNSDKIWNDPFSFTLFLPTTYSAVTYIRLALREVYGGSTIGKRIGNTSWVSYDLRNLGSPDSGYGQTHIVKFPTEYFTIAEPGQYQGLAVFLEFQCSSMDPEMGIGSLQSSFSMYYGTGLDPNFPTYNPPDNSTFEEDEIINNQILDQFGDLENDFASIYDDFGTSLSNFLPALAFCSRCINRFFNITRLKELVQISLSLGIVASLLGIAGSIIGAASRRSRGDD